MEKWNIGIMNAVQFILRSRNSMRRWSYKMFEYDLMIFGAIVGSFLNVCIIRLPKEESIVTPGSHCPHCNQPIKFYDNIPLISYLLLGRKMPLLQKIDLCPISFG